MDIVQASATSAPRWRLLRAGLFFTISMFVFSAVIAPRLFHGWSPPIWWQLRLWLVLGAAWTLAFGFAMRVLAYVRARRQTAGESKM